MAGIPRGPFPTFSETGRALQSGESLQRLSDAMGSNVQNVTAFAGGGKTNATPILGVNAILGTVATGGDSVLLPQGYAGLRILIQNAGAASAQVFGSGTDTINGVSTATGVALANGATALYWCIGVNSSGVGIWLRFVSA